MKEGTRLSVYWPLDDKHYPATATWVYRQGKAVYTSLLYDDLFVEFINLQNEQISLLCDENERVEVEYCSIVIGKIKLYNEKRGEYGPFKELLLPAPVAHQGPRIKGICPKLRTLTFRLNRGGSLSFFKFLIGEKNRLDILREVVESQIIRQYSIGPFHLPEPRVQVLLSSNAAPAYSPSGPGYKYHGVNMRAHPLTLFPKLNTLSNQLSSYHSLPDWNIGAQVVVYRDNTDGIGWHADDTQGESVVCTTVLESPVAVKNKLQTSRPMNFKAQCKKGEKPSDGDEFITLFVCQGDGYSMDGKYNYHFLL